MDPSVVAGLKAALSTDNVWLERSTIAVCIGVMVELADLLFFYKDMSRLQRIVLLFATLLIVAGCGGEWLFEHDSSTKEAQLQQLSNETVAQLAAAEAADNKTAKQAQSQVAVLGGVVA